MDLPFESVNKFHDLMISPELRDKHLTDSWKEELYKLYEKIVKLETRAFVWTITWFRTSSSNIYLFNIVYISLKHLNEVCGKMRT